MTKYRVVVADPPWQFGDPLRMSKVKRGADANYTTMPTKEIALLGSLLVPALADDAVLALWVPSSMLADGIYVMDAWGFDQKQIFTWVKIKQNGSGLAFGMGRMFRGCSEHALIGKRGRPARRDASQRNILQYPTLLHSVKPDALQDRLELMYAGPYLELFARRDLLGWACMGLECPSTRGVDVRDWLRNAVKEATT